MVKKLFRIRPLHLCGSSHRDKTMYDKIMELLSAIGYETLSGSDAMLLNFVIPKVKNDIKNSINHKEIPQELEYVLGCRVVGEFLQNKKTFSPADLSMLDLSGAVVKQIQAGDTNFAFAVGEGAETDESRLNTFISALVGYGAGQLSAFRRIRW